MEVTVIAAKGGEQWVSVTLLRPYFVLITLVDNAYINGLDFDPMGNLVATW